MFQLAWPLAVAELGWQAMGLVDTIMVGRLPNSTVAIGAVSIGTVLFLSLGIVGFGLLFGLDTLVSQSFGARRLEDCHRSLFAATQITLLTSPLLMAALWACGPLLRNSRVDPAVVREAVPYINAVVWGIPTLMLYSGSRRYLQAMNLVKTVTVGLISANIVNALVNWVLIFGKLGFPALGVAGAGWATSISRAYLAAFLLGAIILHDRKLHTGLWRTRWHFDVPRYRELLRLGIPASVQVGLEVSVFAAATMLAGWMGALPLAAHQIALNTVSTTFMVPLGISAAAAVRVGQALGRRDPAGASHAGWTAIAMGVLFMAASATTLLLAPRAIIRIFTPNLDIIQTGAHLLFVAAFFQMFDGIQVVATGALRGAGETRIPMYSAMVCYWLFGLPLGYYLGFTLGWGAPGLWVGLSASLIAMGSFLILTWRRKMLHPPVALDIA